MNYKKKHDLVIYLNEVNEMFDGKHYKILTLKHLSYYANPRLSKKKHTSFKIAKKAGGERVIHAPVNCLKHFLRP
ncbi:MAG TPA: hypothetical protein VK021_11005 [Flavobacteriaceae bacterium]|nr:hypothetical protein [Flavobacteriaceae bacterium]